MRTAERKRCPELAVPRRPLVELAAGMTWPAW